jgi:hypothetical protein
MAVTLMDGASVLEIDLGSLGGDLAGALGVRDDGKIIVGVSTLPGEAALHGFSWTEGVRHGRAPGRRRYCAGPLASLSFTEWLAPD